MEFGHKFCVIFAFTTFLLKSDAATWDCANPPVIVNPHLCCKDPQPTEIAFKCSEKLNFPLPNPNGRLPKRPPDLKAAACFADCILRDSKYLVNSQLDIQYIEKDLKLKFADDKDYIPVMTKAFQKCGPQAQRQLNEIDREFGVSYLSDKCSPYGGLVFGCVYKELFENCPASKWTNSSECETAREYFKQCARTRNRT